MEVWRPDCKSPEKINEIVPFAVRDYVVDMLEVGMKRPVCEQQSPQEFKKKPVPTSVPSAYRTYRFISVTL